MKLLDDGEFSRRLAFKAKELVLKEYTWDRNAENVINIIKEVTGDGTA
jgi:glycosyltransferase involved in cell wall biosynthesis